MTAHVSHRPDEGIWLIWNDSQHVRLTDAELVDVIRQAENLRDEGRKRLWKDGHGIDRLPLTVNVDGEPTPVVVVRADDLASLEVVLDRARNVIAMCSPNAFHWDRSVERERFFKAADEVWEQMTGILRDDEASVESDDEVRPI